ncbi:MAG: ATP-binding protein [Verrucomicrobia bacterium]|nr:ATP-binding protein [Verrucomicrobiota bacterium]
MKFLGRTRELKALQEAWSAARSGFIPIYGRRRVGKSELIVHFMSDKPGLYFVGKRASGEAQLQEFLEAAARAVGDSLLAQARVTNWKSALDLVTQRLPGKGRFILALDEFQWIAEASPELPSVLQGLWDRHWSRSGRMLLILCGSYIGFMEREVLGQRSPLFGRRTAQIFLRPFGYLEAARFHPRFSTVDQARVYAVCGGVPAYLLAFDGAESVEQNLITRLLDENAVLAREPEFLLHEELRDLVPYHSVLMALAQGKSSPAQLAKSTGIDVRGLNYHLNTLVELGYLQRRYPVTEAEPSTRSVRYALDDPLLRFWFRFVFPHQSVLRLLGPTRGFAEVVRPELDAYFGRCFERLCRESLPLLYLREGVRAPFTIGEYWAADVQVDVVGVRQDNWTDLGECKWGDVSSLAGLAAELDGKVRRYPNARNATIGRRVFVRKSSAKARLTDVRVHTLQDLYDLESRS